MFENAPTTLLLCVVCLLSTMFFGPKQHVKLESFNGTEIAHCLWSQFHFLHLPAVVIALIILFSCRHVERQMGLAKFGAYFLLVFAVSILFVVAFAVTASSLDFKAVIAPGPYVFISSLVPFYHKLIPKVQFSNVSVLGIDLSEKTWVYFLLSQLALSEGLYSVLACACGLGFGSIYLNDFLGLQNVLLPGAVNRPVAIFGTLLTSVLPFGSITPRPTNLPVTVNRATGGRAAGAGGTWTAAAAADNNDYAHNGGFGMPVRRSVAGGTAAVVEPPDEESVTTLMNLGFERNDVVRALQQTGNNVEAAANHLLR